jgi:hypothetical protein
VKPKEKLIQELQLHSIIALVYLSLGRKTNRRLILKECAIIYI